MKLSILCMGLLLFVLKTTYAQDTLKTPIQDSATKLSPPVSTTYSNSSSKSIKVDSLKKDSTEMLDIFEQMRHAQLMQDKSMQNKAPAPKKNLDQSPSSVFLDLDSNYNPIATDSLQPKDTIQSIFTKVQATAPMKDSSMDMDQSLEGLFNKTAISKVSKTQNKDTGVNGQDTLEADDLLQSSPAIDPNTLIGQKDNLDKTGAVVDSTPPLFFIDSLPPPVVNTPFTALFQPYKPFDKTTKISSTTRLNILQQQVDYKTSADFTTRYERTSKKEDNYIFDVSVIKLNTEVETMGVQLQFNSNQQNDTTSTFAKPLFDIVGKKTFLEVDSTGKITAVDTSRLGRQVSEVLSGLSMSGGDFELGSNLGLLLSKRGPFEVGDSWTDSLSQNGNDRKTTYTIKTVIDGNLLVLVTGSVNKQGEIKSDGAVFQTKFHGTQKGKLYVDEQTLLVQSREITLNMTGTVNYNGVDLPASATSKIQEKVTHN